MANSIRSSWAFIGIICGQRRREPENVFEYVYMYHQSTSIIPAYVVDDSLNIILFCG